MSIKAGARVRSTKGFIGWPVGLTGVAKSLDPSRNAVTVDLDDGRTTQFPEDALEEYTPVFASHYQAQPIMDEPAPATDDAGPTPDTPLSGEELMNITRSFCR